MNSYDTIAKATEYALLLARNDTVNKNTINVKWEPPLIGNYILMVLPSATQV